MADERAAFFGAVGLRGDAGPAGGAEPHLGRGDELFEDDVEAEFACVVLECTVFAADVLPPFPNCASLPQPRPTANTIARDANDNTRLFFFIVFSLNCLL